MSYIIHTEFDIFSLIVCLVLLVNMFQRGEKHSLADRLFIALLISNMVLLVLDMLGWPLNGQAGAIYAGLFMAVNILYHIASLLPPFLWSLYADYQVFNDKNRIRKLFLPLLVPVFINTLIVLTTPYTRLMFFLDANNFYHRGPWYPLLVTAACLYLIYAFFFVLLRRNRIEKKHFLPLLMFSWFPFIGVILGISQPSYDGLALVWGSITISLLIIYLYIQNGKLNTDYLTGINNRLQLDRHLQAKIRNSSANRSFSGILIDIDDFKKINDQFGHIIGDDALQTTAKLLTGSLRKGDFLARYGGDEFIIILDISDRNDLEKSVERIRANLRSFNLRADKPYRLNLSMGYDVYDYSSAMNEDDFLRHIDKLMYWDKQEAQASRARLKTV